MSERESGGTAESLEFGSGRPLPRQPRTKGSGRRKLVAAVSALAVLGAGVGAVWAWQAFLTTGPQPAEALPASTLAYVAVDLDPAAGQKLAALDFLRKFPSLEKQVGVTDAGDLRKGAFDGLEADLGCGLTYADVEPWVGERFAFAMVDQGGPKPVVVLQVADREKAAAGLKRVTDCADGEFGSALGDEWAVLAESDKVAGDVLRDSAASPLTEDTEFQRWTGEAGEPGVVTLYAAPEAGPALVSAFEDSRYGFYLMPTEIDPLSMLLGMVTLSMVSPVDFGTEEYAMESSAVRPVRPRAGHHVEQKMPPPPAPPTRAELKKLENMTPAEQDRYFQEQFADLEAGQGAAPGTATGGEIVIDDEVVVPEEEFDGDYFPEPSLSTDFRTALMNFSGLGGVVRFDDGALELELVSDRIEGTMGNLVAGTAGDDVLAELPADSAAVFGAGFRDGWGAAFLQRFAESVSPFGTDPNADAVAKFESDTGLAVADLEALGGDSFALVTGSGFDPEMFFQDPVRMKVAARISGGADGVEAALAKVRAAMPAPDRATLQWRRVGDDVLVSGNAAYLDELAASGDLTGAGSFQDAVPDATDAASVFYLNFDSGDWLANSVAKSDRADAEPLAGVGYSLHDEGDRERTLLRFTTED
jgi:hypothetical protein